LGWSDKLSTRAAHLDARDVSEHVERSALAYGSGTCLTWRTPMDYDPLAPETLEDPFPSYQELRARCPVHHYADFEPPFFTLSRHEDVLAGLRDWQLWSMRYGDNPQYLSPSGLFNDPPEHTTFRRLFNRAFTPRTVGRLDREIEQIGRQLLDAVAFADHRDRPPARRAGR
jgi:cytochrome P450